MSNMGTLVMGEKQALSESAKTVNSIQRVILYGMNRSREDQLIQVLNLWVWESKGIANEES